MPPSPPLAAALARGGVIPAHPLALTAERRLDERRQRALSRYYVDAGAAGLAVGVHTTQFAIRQEGLLQPVLALAAEVMDQAPRPLVRVAGICGATAQAVAEAGLARDLGYDVGLLSLAALVHASDQALLAHARAVGDVMPLMGFYLQPAVGGRPLGPAFWRQFCALPAVVAIKVAPFDRYRTLDVMRGVADSGRAAEIALFTGNDDNIVGDLLTTFDLEGQSLRFAGGVLGQWAVWTRRAVTMLEELKTPSVEHLRLGAALTDANAALFDAAHGFRGCIAGIHEALRRQGLLAGTWCLDPQEGLSPGQAEEIDRVFAAHPHLRDDDFVAANLDRWLA
jgi:dihydrodipicolinate synthase/N-acetylneuraminate lyase